MSDAEMSPEAAYKSLMTEVKVRLSWIEAALAGPSALPPPALREFGFLQLRMCCELLALACLIAHGDLEESLGKATGEYAADRIMAALERLHPDFYPFPVIHRRPAPGRHHFDLVEEGFLTKEEMLRLYRSCGDVLHAGSLKRLRRGRTLGDDLTDVTAPAERLRQLLALHAIKGLDNQHASICFLHLGSDRPVEFVRAFPEEEPPSF